MCVRRPQQSKLKDRVTIELRVYNKLTHNFTFYILSGYIYIWLTKFIYTNLKFKSLGESIYRNSSMRVGMLGLTELSLAFSKTIKTAFNAIKQNQFIVLFVCWTYFKD